MATLFLNSLAPFSSLWPSFEVGWMVDAERGMDKRFLVVLLAGSGQMKQSRIAKSAADTTHMKASGNSYKTQENEFTEGRDPLELSIYRRPHATQRV